MHEDFYEASLSTLSDEELDAVQEHLMLRKAGLSPDAMMAGNTFLIATTAIEKIDARVQELERRHFCPAPIALPNHTTKTVDGKRIYRKKPPVETPVGPDREYDSTGKRLAPTPTKRKSRLLEAPPDVPLDTGICYENMTAVFDDGDPAAP